MNLIQLGVKISINIKNYTTKNLCNKKNKSNNVKMSIIYRHKPKLLCALIFKNIQV